jgi:hypothetical protein
MAIGVWYGLQCVRLWWRSLGARECYGQYVVILLVCGRTCTYTLVTSTQSTQLHCDGIEAKQLPWSCCKGGLVVAAEAKDCLRSCCKGGLVVVTEAKDCRRSCCRVGLLWQ